MPIATSFPPLDSFRRILYSKHKAGGDRLAEKARIDWIDMAKGIGMFCVIYSHMCTGHAIYRWMYSFHLPLFFFLSGFVFHAKQPFPRFAARKAKALLIPYFALAVPMIFVEGLLTRGPGQSLILRFAQLAGEVAVQRRLWTLWYLACLFLLNLLFYPLVRYIRKEWLLGLICLLLGAAGVGYAKAGLPPLPWNLDVCFPAMPFFAAGYLAGAHYDTLEPMLQSRAAGPAFCLLGLVNLAAGYPGIFGSSGFLDMNSGQYGIPLLTYTAAFAGVACVIIAARRFVWKPLVYIGRNSLLYFAWHQVLMLPLIYALFPRLGIPIEGFPSSAAMLGEKLLETVFILAVLTVCNELLLHSRLRFVLGR